MEISDEKKPPAWKIPQEDRFMRAFDRAREKLSKRKSTLKSYSQRPSK